MPAESTSPRSDSASAATVRVGHVGRPHDRWVAPGGWRRALFGTSVGGAAGLLLGVAMRGDDRGPCGVER